MLYTTAPDRPLRIACIDPGTDTLGLSMLDLPLVPGEPIALVFSTTIQAKQGIGTTPHRVSVHGERYARLVWHHDRLLDYFSLWRPNYFISESPFLSRFPQAFAALTECMLVIQQAVEAYDCSVPLDRVDPPSAKRAVGGIVGKGGSKENIRECVLKLVEDGTIKSFLTHPLHSLTEHQIDSIAVGYYKALSLLQGL